MNGIFTNIPKILYEGKESLNPLAFKFYDGEKIVPGKKMKEHLPFAKRETFNQDDVDKVKNIIS